VVQLERNININPSSSPTPLHSTCSSSSDRVASLYALTLLRFHLLSFYYRQDHPLLQAGSLFASTFIPAERPSIRVSYIHTRRVQYLDLQQNETRFGNLHHIGGHWGCPGYQYLLLPADIGAKGYHDISSGTYHGTECDAEDWVYRQHGTSKPS
jgi:hypothetical protein